MTANEPARQAPGTLDSSAARRSAARSTAKTINLADVARDDADLAFVQRLVAREDAAWSELTTRYRVAILRGISSGFAELGVPMTSARLEDVCAEVVFILFKNECAALRSFQGRSKFATWLTVVSRRTCLARQLAQQHSIPGGRRTTTEIDLSTLPERGSSWELTEQLQVEMQAIQACLPELSTSDRSIIERFFFQEQSYQEIANQLGITKNAVGPKLTRARNRLRRLVALYQQRLSASSSQPLDPRNPNDGS